MKYLLVLLSIVLFPMCAVRAQELECRVISKPVGSSGQGRIADVEVKLEEQSPPLPPGFQVTGGGCDFGQNDRFGLIVRSEPTGSGYRCSAKAASDNTDIFATAYAIVCRTKRLELGNGTHKVPFSNYGLGGDAVAITRAIPDSIPYSIRICNLVGGAAISVELSTSLNVRLDKTQCVEIDRPKMAFFRTPDTVSAEVRGSYALYQPGTFPAKPVVSWGTAVPHEKGIEIGQYNFAKTTCHPPLPGDPFDSKSYWGYCNLAELKSNKNYRVCFDNGYSNQKNALEYAGGLLRIVLDRKLMAKPPNNGQLSPYEYLSIAPATCRDFFGVSDASVLVVNNTWNDQAVSMVTYRYAEISAPK